MRRALAEIINVLAVEVVVRQDLAETSDRADTLAMVTVTHEMFLAAWGSLESVSPMSYAIAWDGRLSSHSDKFRNKMIERLRQGMGSITGEVRPALVALVSDESFSNVFQEADAVTVSCVVFDNV